MWVSRSVHYNTNKETGGQAVLDRLLSGESCALVTDAGTPAISDPGEGSSRHRAILRSGPNVSRRSARVAVSLWGRRWSW